MPLSPADFLTVRPPNAPSYAAPLVGPMLAEGIGGLPQDYFQGTQMARQLAMQQPVIDPRTGQPTTDIGQIISAANRVGGLEGALKTMPFLYGQEIMKRTGGSDYPAVPPTQNPPAAAGPAQITGQRQGTSAPMAANAPGQPDTIRSLYTGLAAGKDVSPVIEAAAKRLGVDPDADLSPELRQGAMRFWQATSARTKTASASANVTPSEQGVATTDENPQNASPLSSPAAPTETSAPPAYALAEERNRSVAAPAPFMGGPTSGAPAPVTTSRETASPSTGIMPNGPAPVRAAPAAPAPAPTQVAQAQPGAQGAPLSPASQYVAQRFGPQWVGHEGQLAQIFRNRATELGQYIQAGTPAGISPEGLKERIAGLNDSAKRIEELMKEAATPTGAMKEAAGLGLTIPQYQAQKTAAEDEAKAQAKLLGDLATKGLDAQGRIGQIQAITQLGEKVPYGVIPKIQSILGHYGIATEGLTDIQAYERAIDFMAPQLRPVGSGRLLQTELNSFKAALGGLMTTKEGRRISAENLRLLSEYSAKIGRIASDTDVPIRQRMQQIYDTKPPKLAVSAPAQPGTSQSFNSPADLDAAIKAGKVKSGEKVRVPGGILTIH